MNENIKKIISSIATLGPIGFLPFGRIIASILALPLWFLICHMFHITIITQVIITFIMLGVLVIITQLALCTNQIKTHSSIMLGSIAGLLIVLFSLPFWFKLLIFSFVLYHVVYFLQRLFMFKGYLACFNELPGALAIFVDDIFTGIFVSLFLTLMLWIMH